MHLASSLRAVVVAAIALAPLTAHADPAKAWAAAKAHLPGNAAFVGGVNVGDLAKSSMVKMVIPLAAPELKKGIDLLKKACGVDAWTAIEAVTWATDDKLDDGVLFLAVKGIDQAKVNACVEGMAKEDGEKNPTATATAQGAITELSTGSDKYYFMWIGSDVIAVPLSHGDKAQLERWTPKKGALAKSKVGKQLAKVNTKSTAWGASTIEKELEGSKIKASYGSLVLRGGKLDADVHLAFDSAATAKASTDKLNAELAGKTEAKALLDKLSITSAKDEMILKAKLTESELMQAAGALMP